MSTFSMINLPSDDESDDEDFVPSGVVESDEDVSGPDDYEEEDGEDGTSVKRKRGGAKGKKGGKKKKKADVNPRLEKIQQQDTDTDVLAEVRELKKAEREAALWEDFLKDVEPPPKAVEAKTKTTDVLPTANNLPKASSSDLKETDDSKPKPVLDSSDKPSVVTITKEYNFAGDTIKVEQKVAADSEEAKKFLKAQEEQDPSTSIKPSTSSCALQSLKPGPAAAIGGVKRSSGGLSALVSQITKKPKMSILDKSKLDWNQFKDKEGIGEELQTFNRGKDGFLERQRFLERTDFRQFEIEKSLRDKERVHRLV